MLMLADLRLESTLQNAFLVSRTCVPEKNVKENMNVLEPCLLTRDIIKQWWVVLVWLTILTPEAGISLLCLAKDGPD